MGHIPLLHIFNHRIRRQAVLREPDSACAHVCADGCVRFRVEAVFREQFVKRLVARLAAFGSREQGVEEFLDDAAQLGLRATRAGETIQLAACCGGEVFQVATEELWRKEQVVAFGHEPGVGGKEVGEGAVFVDSEIVNHWLHRKRQALGERLFRCGHDDLKPVLQLGFSVRRDDKTHAAPGHSSEHPKAPEVFAKFAAHLLDKPLGVVVRGPRDDGLNRAAKVLRG